MPPLHRAVRARIDAEDTRKIAEVKLKNPDLSNTMLAERFGVTPLSVRKALLEHGVHQPPRRREVVAKTMDVREFRVSGLLQEINRQFLHPLGLALSVEIHEDGTETFGPIRDERAAFGGMVFSKEEIMSEDTITKMRYVQKMRNTRNLDREKKYGFNLQPVGAPPTSDPSVDIDLADV